MNNIFNDFVVYIFRLVKPIRKATDSEIFQFFSDYFIHSSIVQENYLKVLFLLYFSWLYQFYNLACSTSFYILARCTSFDDLPLEIAEMILKTMLASCKYDWRNHVVTIFEPLRMFPSSGR